MSQVSSWVVWVAVGLSLLTTATVVASARLAVVQRRYLATMQARIEARVLAAVGRAFDAADDAADDDDDDDDNEGGDA